MFTFSLRVCSNAFTRLLSIVAEICERATAAARVDRLHFKPVEFAERTRNVYNPDRQLSSS